jgi:hypothetical protein
MHACEFHFNFLGFEAFQSQKADQCSLLHPALFVRMLADSEAPHHGASYRSVSVGFLLLDSRFRKEYRYSLLISPFQQGRNHGRGHEVIGPYIAGHDSPYPVDVPDLRDNLYWALDISRFII